MDGYKLPRMEMLCDGFMIAAMDRASDPMRVMDREYQRMEARF